MSRIEVQLRIVLTFALDAGKWSAVHLGTLPPDRGLPVLGEQQAWQGSQTVGSFGEEKYIGSSDGQ